ncbi:MAG: Nif3-like dinuclear metal center hexameric protein [Archaeoglobaceae archaeon]
MNLTEIVDFLDDYLHIADWEDKSMNGLQVEGRKKIEKIVFAVDACMDTFHQAEEKNADMLIVHHGLIWGSVGYIKGQIMKRLKYLLENELSLYAAHLPLDAHPEIGNNVELMRILRAKIEEPFGEYHGKAIGYLGSFDQPKTLEEINDMVKRQLNVDPLVLNFGPNDIKTVACVSGAGSSTVPEAGEKEVDLLVTGETGHSSYHTAKEFSLNIMFAGHYATETLGVKALMNVLRNKFDVEVEFIDVPTGL